MTRFKFRAWHKDRKEMFDVRALFDSGSVGVVAVVGGDESTGPIAEEVLLEAEGVVVMQSTGLTDKNGKEIFEGDVIQGPNDVVAKVVWDNGSFVFSGEGVRSSFPGKVTIWLTHPELMIVIGDIYSCPDLLCVSTPKG